jgi:hypothetical protein
MPTRSQSHIVIYRAFNTLTGALQSGDVANHSLQWSRDGAAASAMTNAPAAHATAGFYQVAVSASEADCEIGTLIGISSTSSVLLEKVSIAYDLPVKLAASQSLYAPSKAGDAMSLTMPALNAVGEELSETLTEPLSLSIDGFTGSALAQLRALPVVTQTPVVMEGLITLVQGDDYFHADGRSVALLDTTGQWPSLSGGSVELLIQGGDTSVAISGSIFGEAEQAEVRFELESEETEQLAGVFDYQIVATLESGRRVTLQLGKLKVVSRIQ